MAKYLVKPGYCLHLPHGRFAQPGEEVELTSELEKKILEDQGWKVAPVIKPAMEQKRPEPKEPEEPEDKAVTGPPRDRAVKGVKAK